MTVQNLHCSELARWPGDPAETLAGLRAALAPDGEEILESTPDGVGGCFYEEWQTASETGMVRHFFPVVDGAALPHEGGRRGLADREEHGADRTSSI